MWEFPDFLFDAIGIFGMGCFLFAYFMLQRGTWPAHGFKYLFANLLGSVCLIISLWWRWNLAAFLLEAAWFLISLYGLTKWYRNTCRGAMQTPPFGGD